MSVTRRDFLTTSAAATAGVALSSHAAEAADEDVKPAFIMAFAGLCLHEAGKELYRVGCVTETKTAKVHQPTLWVPKDEYKAACATRSPEDGFVSFDLTGYDLTVVRTPPAEQPAELKPNRKGYSQESPEHLDRFGDWATLEWGLSKKKLHKHRRFFPKWYEKDAIACCVTLTEGAVRCVPPPTVATLPKWLVNKVTGTDRSKACTQVIAEWSVNTTHVPGRFSLLLTPRPDSTKPVCVVTLYPQNGRAARCLVINAGPPGTSWPTNPGDHFALYNALFDGEYDHYEFKYTGTGEDVKVFPPDKMKKTTPWEYEVAEFLSELKDVLAVKRSDSTGGCPPFVEP